MSWEQRLREMVLAGGALAVTACGASTAASSQAESDATSNLGDDADTGAPFEFPCCNANSDPCCPIAYCAGGVGPDAAVYIDCEQSRSACEATNGYYEPQPDGSLSCTH